MFEDICGLCGEKKKITQKMKDGTKICAQCERKKSDGFDVDWKKITKDDFHYFDEIQMMDDNFKCDFEFEGFKADTKLGVFAIKYHKQLFELKSIKKYYIKYIFEEINSMSDSHNTEVKGARLVMELDHPVISSVHQKIDRNKSSIFEVFDVLDLASRKSYVDHNEKLLQFLKKQTGKDISMAKRENR